MQQTFSNFESNLKLACSTRKSISDLCRAIGVNRQQFNRYLNAGTAPSPHNRLRIAAAFGLDPVDFDLPPLAFWHKLNERQHPQPKEGPLVDAYPGNILALRPYLGFYQTWHVSPSWPDRIVCSLAELLDYD